MNGPDSVCFEHGVKDCPYCAARQAAEAEPVVKSKSRPQNGLILALHRHRTGFIFLAMLFSIALGLFAMVTSSPRPQQKSQPDYWPWTEKRIKFARDAMESEIASQKKYFDEEIAELPEGSAGRERLVKHRDEMLDWMRQTQTKRIEDGIKSGGR